MLELYYNFFKRFCDVNKFEELKKDTDSLYLALSEMSCTIAFEKNLKLNGPFWEQKIAKMISQLIQQPTSFLEPAAQNI